MDPEVLLLDEPLSALDALTRAKLQDEIERIWSQEKKTVVLITNDVDEAILLADRIIPLKPGPDATLGPEFTVDLPRPRDAPRLNHDAAYKRLRAAITQYLMDVGVERAATPATTARRCRTSCRCTSMPARRAPIRDAAAQPDRGRAIVEFFEVAQGLSDAEGAADRRRRLQSADAARASSSR